MMVQDFLTKYELSNSYISVNKPKLPKSIFTKVAGDREHIDEYWFIKRLRFKRKVTLANQDLYYYLTLRISDSTLAKYLGSAELSIKGWRTYFSQNLFKRSELKLDIKLSRRDIVMAKLWWRLERRLRRKGLSIEKIIDRRIKC